MVGCGDHARPEWRALKIKKWNLDSSLEFLTWIIPIVAQATLRTSVHVSGNVSKIEFLNITIHVLKYLHVIVQLFNVEIWCFLRRVHTSKLQVNTRVYKFDWDIHFVAVILLAVTMFADCELHGRLETPYKTCVYRP